MPIARIKAGEWAPDVGEIGNSTLYKVRGAVPIGNQWLPSPYVFPGNDVLKIANSPGDVYGFHVHSTEDANLAQQSLMFYAADQTDIYRSNAANSRTLTLATGILPALSATPGSGIQFTSYGNQIVATDYNQHMVYASTPSTDFINLVLYTPPDTVVQGYRPKARYLATIKNQLLIGHVKFDATAMPTGSSLTASTVYPSLIMWSAVDDIRRFGSPAVTQDVSFDGSDYQLIADDYGAITGLVGGDYAYIFKERAIYRMDGPPYTIRPVVTGMGTLYCNSIIKMYDDIYFWGPAGPTVLRAGSSIPEVLGLGKVARSIADWTTWEDTPDDLTNNDVPLMTSFVTRAINIGGFADYKLGLVAWISSDHDTVIGGDQLYTNPGRVLIYNINTNSFGYFVLGAPGYFPKTIAQFHYPSVFSSFQNGYIFSDTLFLGATASASGAGDGGSIFIRGFGHGPDSTAAEPQNDESLTTYEEPMFEFNFITLPVSEGNEANEFPATRITKIRPLYNQTLGKALAFDVYVFTTSRFPVQETVNGGGGALTAHASFNPYTTSFREENGWVSIDGAFGTHHKIRITFSDPGEPSAPFYRDIGWTSDLVTLEVEYVQGDSEGSPYVS